MSHLAISLPLLLGALFGAGVAGVFMGYLVGKKHGSALIQRQWDQVEDQRAALRDRGFKTREVN